MAISQLRPRIALTATEQANIKEAYGYLETFLPAVSVDAALGSAGQESSWNPTILGDGGASYGFWQWQGSRLTGPNGLRTWCAANGFDPASIKGQCAFLKYELPTANGMGPQNAAIFAAGGDLTALTTLFSEKFERPSTPDLPNRIADAQMVAALMAGTPIPTPTPTPVPTPTPTPQPPYIPPPLPPIIPPAPPPVVVMPPSPAQPQAAIFDPLTVATVDLIIGSIFKWARNQPTSPALPTIPSPLPPIPIPTPLPPPTQTPAPTPTIPIDLGTLLGMITSQTNSSLTSLLPGLLQSALPGILQSILPGLLAGLRLPIPAADPKKD